MSVLYNPTKRYTLLFQKEKQKKSGGHWVRDENLSIGHCHVSIANGMFPTHSDARFVDAIPHLLQQCCDCSHSDRPVHVESRTHFEWDKQFSAHISKTTRRLICLPHVPIFTSLLSFPAAPHRFLLSSAVSRLIVCVCVCARACVGVALANPSFSMHTIRRVHGFQLNFTVHRFQAIEQSSAFHPRAAGIARVMSSSVITRLSVLPQSERDRERERAREGNRSRTQALYERKNTGIWVHGSLSVKS
jgi:hypothetical protein